MVPDNFVSEEGESVPVIERYTFGVVCCVLETGDVIFVVEDPNDYTDPVQEEMHNKLNEMLGWL